MSLLIIKPTLDTSTYFFAITPVEAGIVVRKFQVRYYPEVDERFKNASGETFLRSVSKTFSRDIACEGEFAKAGVGIMLFTVGMALSFANNVNVFTPIGGTMLLDDATTNADRHGWYSISIRASCNPLL
jgi:hypothetical protein